MSDFSNEGHRFGRARWAQEHELRAAGLFVRKGPQIAYWNQTPVHLDDDPPIITFGGAGSGKLRDLLGYVVCNTPGQRMLILDPRGEQAAISRHVHAAYNEYAYHGNPWGLGGSPCDGCNPLDVLQIDSPFFVADCKLCAESLIPISVSGGAGKYFSQRAQDWSSNLLMSLVEVYGGTSLPDFYRIINAVEAVSDAWTNHQQAMLNSRFESVRRTASEMITKQADTPKEFGAIMGEVIANISFLDDPVMLRWLERGGFSLAELCNPNRVCKIFLNFPAEFLSILSPVVRLFFTVAMLYKSRFPERPRVLLLVDEAGQLGNFAALLRAFTYGRGAGIRAWALFQDCSQVNRNFGATALQSFVGSAQMRQFFGVRDLETAKMISAMLGSETLRFDETLKQDEARRRKWEMLRRLLDGEDPINAAYDLSHFRRAEEHRSSQARSLMLPEEILSLPEDRQILFISGKNLPPILAHKYPYFTRREMAGLYLPNPAHPPSDKVRLATRFGTKWADVITEPVPEFLRSFPQHANSDVISYVRGYRPF